MDTHIYNTPPKADIISMPMVLMIERAAILQGWIITHSAAQSNIMSRT